jgi:hypothetical protein
VFQFHCKAQTFGPIIVITTSSPLLSGEVSAPYTTTIGGQGGTQPYTFTVVSGSLPPGLNLASNGVLSGTPTTANAYTFGVRLTDATGHNSNNVVFGLTIIPAVVITTSSPLPSATQSSAYSTTMAASGGTTPYAWSLTSQTGSNGWSVSPAGLVTGTPGTVETDVLSIKVTDALGVIASGSFNLQVNSGVGLVGAGSHQVLNFPSGFSGQNTIQVGSSATQTGSVISVTASTASQHQAGSAWYKTKVNITAFTTTFTFQIPVAPPIPPYPNNNPMGFSFAVQNTTAPPGPVGFVGLFYVADANLCGYGIFQTQSPSGGSNVGIKFDLNNITQCYKNDGIATPNSTGLYVNGGPWAALQPQNDLNPLGISLYAGHVMSCAVAYDGTILQMTLLDTVTNVQCRFEWPINIPQVVGANTAWVGFTGGTVPVLAQNILTWQFLDGTTTFSRLSAPTFGVPAGSYTGTQNVSLSGPGGASIYYTTNGQLPTTSSTLYTGTAITVAANTILQAVAVQSGFTDSFVALANYQIAAGGTPLINFPSGFAGTSNLVNLVGYAQLNSSTKVRLTDTNANGGEVGCLWYAAPVPVSTFTTHFQVQFNAGATGQGMTFCIQNVAPSSTTSTSQSALSWVSGGPTTMGLNFAGLGYAGPTGSNGQANAGIFESVAIKFDLTNNTTGIYTNGALPTTPQTTITGLTMSTGNPLNVTLAYNGTTLTLTIQDSVTLGSFTTNFTVNIPSQVGANTAYVGFTGSTGFNINVANQDILNWTYATP